MNYSKYTTDNISFDILENYVFHQLHPAEEKQLEIFLDNHESYAEMVDGMLTYCLNEGINDKTEFEKKIEKQELDFKRKFENLTDKKSLNKVQKKNQNFRLTHLLLLAFFVVTGLFLWNYFNPKSKIEKSETPEYQFQQPLDNSTPAIPKKESSKEIVENEQEKNGTEKRNKKVNPAKKKDYQNPEKTEEIKAEDSFANVIMDVEKATPLKSAADTDWYEEFAVMGENMNIRNAEQALLSSDSTQSLLYYLGLFELTKDNPNYNKAIEMLSKVNENEYPDAQWYLFRAYLKTRNLEGARKIFEEMNQPPKVDYYQNKYFNLLPESVFAFFQSKGN